MIIDRLVRAVVVDRPARTVDDRLRLAPVLRRALAKVFPDHWSFMLGELALYSFVALILTGVYLTFFFDPSSAERVYTGGYAPLDGERTSAAYASIVRLSYDIRAGLLIRQTHHWAALVFVGAIVVHLMRIFFTGAFRKPREINWLIGVTMLALALFNGFTGYSMPDDLLSGTGLRIIYSVVESAPVIGEWLVFLAFGGEFPSDEIIPRMFVSHVFLVPAVLIALISAHLAILVRQKHSQFPGPGRNEHNVVGSRFWPGYLLRTLALFAWVLAVLFALGGLAQINPVWIFGPFDPSQVSAPAQPDWYVAWGEGALRLFPPLEFRIFGHLVPAPFFPGVVLGGLTFVGLYAWPFLERLHTRDRWSHQLLDRPREHPVRLGIGVAALVFYAVLIAAGADDIIARLLRVPLLGVVNVLRVLVLVLPAAAGLLAFLVARALRLGGSASVGELTWAELWLAGRRADRAGHLDPRRVIDTRRATAAADGTSRPGTGPPPAAPSRDRHRGPQRAEHPHPSPRVESWQTTGGTWRWRYRDDTADVTLTANQVSESRTEAEAAARTAYPETPVVTIAVPPPAGRLAGASRTAGRRAGRLAAWLALLIIGIVQRRRRHRP